MSHTSDGSFDAERRPVRRALVSVSDKSGLEVLASALSAAGAEILSTGGTAERLRALGCAVRDVSEITGLPEMLDGRVKTLHPAVHAGLLARRDDPSHQAAMAAHGFGEIDLLVVTLYPFEETVAAGADFAACVEQIDIGGPALMRAAAKNHSDVAVLSDPGDYAEAATAVAAGGATLAMRRRWAAKAYLQTARYDAAVAAWFAQTADIEAANVETANLETTKLETTKLETTDATPALLTLAAPRLSALRYGENPHQAAALYAGPDARPGAANARLLQGKALSYNNIADADAAFELVADLDRFARPACVIVKHANPCGAALGESLADAYARALACDPTSAFGGVVAFNRPLDRDAAAQLLAVFTEVVIAPAVTEDAAAAFAGKPALRLLDAGGLPTGAAGGLKIRSVAGGFLAQDRDAAAAAPEALRVATRRAPTAMEQTDLLFAEVVAKHVASNAIVLAKDGATIGVGAGQMSRLDAARIAVWKAADRLRADSPDGAPIGDPARPALGAVVASDAFFPFADALEATIAAGVTAVIQPGGSVRDAEVAAAADAADLAMVLTGRRHFRH